MKAVRSRVFLTFVGVIMMLSKGNWQTMINMSFNLGDLIVIAAMFGLATYSINLRKIPSELTSIEILFAIIIIGCTFLLPFYLLETIFYQPVPINSVSIYSILGMAFFVVVVGMLTWNIGIQMLGPAISSVFLNLIPVFGTVLSVIFLGEIFHLYHLICLVLVCVGMLMVLSQNLKKGARQL